MEPTTRFMKSGSVLLTRSNLTDNRKTVEKHKGVFPQFFIDHKAMSCSS